MFGLNEPVGVVGSPESRQEEDKVTSSCMMVIEGLELINRGQSNQNTYRDVQTALEGLVNNLDSLRGSISAENLDELIQSARQFQIRSREGQLAVEDVMRFRSQYESAKLGFVFGDEDDSGPEG